MISSTPARSLHSPAQRHHPNSLVRLRPTKRARNLKIGKRRLTDWLLEIQASLPLSGRSIQIDVLPGLTASRGKLLSGQAERGQAVHAACFIRRRVIVLERELLASPPLARAILVHELFHFAWVRCGNERRRNYAALLCEEISARARGELGESSEIHKHRLGEACSTVKDRVWRDYVCESFCDSAAWYFSAGHQIQVTLAQRWQKKRASWFTAWVATGNGLWA